MFVITGDVQKAFLEIRIDERHWDAVERILWYNKLKDQLIKELRCFRVIFGASPSPYILGATIKRHLERYKEEFTDTIKTLKKDTYVNNMQGGGDSIKDLK